MSPAPTGMPPELTGLNLYNQNNGISQNPMCGQSLMTKLLRTNNHKSKQSPSKSQNADGLFRNTPNKDDNVAPANCLMSPVGKVISTTSSSSSSSSNHNKPKKSLTKFRGKNMYENFETSSSMEMMDTESCSSDDIFSETTSTASSSFFPPLGGGPPANDFAQFDPSNANNNSIPDETADASGADASPPHQQQHRKSGSSWAASLPAVVEEDSQSEQSSQQQLQRNGSSSQGQPTLETAVGPTTSHQDSWRNIPSILTTKSPHHHPNDSHDEDISDYDEDVFEQPLKNLSSTVSGMTTPPETGQHPNNTSNSSVSSVGSKGSSVLGGFFFRSAGSFGGSPHHHHHKMKRVSKQELMREARDLRIQQAMEEQLQRSEQEELQDRDYKLAMFDAEASFPFPTAHVPVEQQHALALQPPSTEDVVAELHNTASSTSISVFDPFRQDSMTSFSPSAAAGHTNYSMAEMPPSRMQPQGHAEQATLQQLLSEQQATLKEMSLQNYQYRRELSECQELFGKWKVERDQQQATIAELVKQKEAFASEAKFLRNELSSIRSELTTFQSEHKKRKQQQHHAEKQQQVKPVAPEKEPNESKSQHATEGTPKKGVRFAPTAETENPTPTSPPAEQLISPPTRQPCEAKQDTQEQLEKQSKLEDAEELVSPSKVDNKQQSGTPSNASNKAGLAISSNIADKKQHFENPSKPENEPQFNSPSKLDDNPQLRSPNKLTGKPQLSNPSKESKSDSKAQLGSPDKPSVQQRQFRSPTKTPEGKQQQFGSPNKSNGKPQFSSPSKKSESDDNKGQLSSPSKPSVQQKQFRSPTRTPEAKQQQFGSPAKSSDTFLTAVGRLKLAANKEGSGQDSLISGLRHGTPPLTKYGSAKKKPFVSGLRSSSASKKKDSPKKTALRSVKFHDPPLNKEWTIFPADDMPDGGLRLLPQKSPTNSRNTSTVNQSGIQPSSLTKESRDQEQSNRVESNPDRVAPGDPGRVTFDAGAAAPHHQKHPLTPQQQRSLFTPTNATNEVVARGRAPDRENRDQGSTPNRECSSTNAYKQRLEAIQKNRQQRVQMQSEGAMSGASG